MSLVSEDNKKKGLFVQTFGCQMNMADSEQIKASLQSHGFKDVKKPQDADLILINTCSVREKAEDKTGSFAHNLKNLKNDNPELKIAVTGCVAQQEGEKIIQDLPFVDMVIGPDNVEEIPWALDQIIHQRSKKIVRTEFDTEPRIWNHQTKISNPGSSVFINIMKGCDHFCSYCIVPMTRGREKSRPIKDILTDVKKFADQGVKEFYFLGQNINTFGKRASESLHELFYQVADIEKVKRMRFTTSHPGDLKPELINAFKELPKLCSHFHLPVQSGSNKILRSMRRFYTKESYLEKVYALREARPDIAISTDIIVGFPGETDKDFEQTINLCEQVKFDNAYSFLFSPRPGTSASKRVDNLSRDEKNQRLYRLQALLQDQSRESHANYLGQTHEVMIEGRSRKDQNQFTGRNSQSVPVHFDPGSNVYTAGDLVNIKIVSSSLTSLKGELA